MPAQDHIQTYTASRSMRCFTILAGAVRDQAALHGVLSRVRDLGLALISVNQVEPDNGVYLIRTLVA